MKIQKASEDYLEAMLIMQEKHGFIRSIDIAQYLGVTKPSVSYSTKKLRENGFISMSGNGLITLTDTGRGIAENMYRRHRLLTEFLVMLGVDEQTAREDACKMEHDMSQRSFEALCRHAEKGRR